MTMTQDLLSREAVDRKLVDDAIKRMHGRALVGIRFDEKQGAWFVLLKNGMEALVRLSSEVLSGSPRDRHPAKRQMVRARKKK